MVNNADVALQRWRRFAWFLGGCRRRPSSLVVIVGAAAVVDVVYEEQAGAHGDGQKHGCSMTLRDMK